MDEKYFSLCYCLDFGSTREQSCTITKDDILLIFAFKTGIQFYWPAIISEIMFKEKRLPFYHIPIAIFLSRVGFRRGKYCCFSSLFKIEELVLHTTGMVKKDNNVYTRIKNKRICLKINLNLRKLMNSVQAKEREEKHLSSVEQALLIRLDKIYNYHLKKDEEYDETLEIIHLSLQSIKR